MAVKVAQEEASGPALRAVGWRPPSFQVNYYTPEEAEETARRRQSRLRDARERWVAAFAVLQIVSELYDKDGK